MAARAKLIAASWSERWRLLAGRERVALVTGALATLLLLGYALLWLPLDRSLERLRQTVADEREELLWMKNAAAQLARSGPARGGSASRVPGASGADDVSLPTFIDRSARLAGLGPTLKQVELRAPRQVSVRFQQVEFDPLLTWLARIEAERDVGVISASIEPAASSGRVDAQLLLGDETPR